MFKSLINFLIVGYDEEGVLFSVTNEAFKTAKDAQHYIDKCEDSAAKERWFVVQSIGTENI